MHYFGIAVCREGWPVELLLDKFDDNRCLEWVDAHEYEEYDYQNGTLKAFRMPDGTLRNKYDEEFAVESESPAGFMCVHYEAPEGCEEVVAPKRELYPDYDEYLVEWCGYVNDPELGIGSWDNPNGHYDYYRIGGRWSGGIAATRGDRVEYCWEVDYWLKEHPGESWYAEHGFDSAAVDDIIKEEQHAPAFFVTPDGEWVDESCWGGSYDKHGAEVDAAFWDMCIEPLRGNSGYTAYVIDAHN